MATKRRVLFISLSVAIVFALVLVFCLPPREPRYQGKRLTKWLEGYNYPSVVACRSANNAVRHIGTNAIPVLLRLLQAKDSALKTKLAEIVLRQNFIHVRPDFFTFDSPQHNEAACAFAALGFEARSAVPALMEIYEKRISEDSQVETVRALGVIGPGAEKAVPVLLRDLDMPDPVLDGVIWDALGRIHSRPDLVLPVMLAVLGSTNSNERRQALSIISAFGIQARVAVPHLLKILHDDDDEWTRARAVDTLVAVAGPEYEMAIPALKQALKDKESFVRIAAVDAFYKMNAEQAAVLPVLLDLLRDSDDDSRKRGAELLLGFQGDATPAIPALTQLLQNPVVDVRQAAAEAVLHVAPRDSVAWELAMSLLRAQLKDPDGNVRADGAMALLRFNPDDAEAFKVTVECLKSSDSQYHAVCLIEDLGLGAKPFVPILVPILEKLLDTDGDEQIISVIAERMLEQIAPEVLSNYLANLK